MDHCGHDPGNVALRPGDIPMLADLAKTQSTVITNTDGKKFGVKTTNALLKNPKFIGFKTGWLDETGGNLTAIYNYNGTQILIVGL